MTTDVHIRTLEILAALADDEIGTRIQRAACLFDMETPHVRRALDHADPLLSLLAFNDVDGYAPSVVRNRNDAGWHARVKTGRDDAFVGHGATTREALADLLRVVEENAAARIRVAGFIARVAAGDEGRAVDQATGACEVADPGPAAALSVHARLDRLDRGYVALHDATSRAVRGQDDGEAADAVAALAVRNEIAAEKKS